MKQLNYRKSRKNFGSDIPPDHLQFYIPDAGVARPYFRNDIDPRAQFLPSPIAGIKAHVGAGQSIREGYDNIDAYPNTHRAAYVQTTVEKFAAAVEQLDAAGRQSHPLTAYLRQGRHYPYANWLSHGGHLLDAIPNQNIFCVAGCKVSASGGGDH